MFLSAYLYHRHDAIVSPMSIQVLVFLCMCGVTFAQADHRSGFHWARTSSEFTLGVIDNVENNEVHDWDDNFDWALGEWSKSGALNLLKVSSDTPIDRTSQQGCISIEGYINVCNGDYGRTSWNGRAQWSYTTGYGADPNHDGHITSCIVLVNDNAATISDEKKILCHEIGHCLGLGHTSEDGRSDGTCMDYSSDITNSRAPNDGDYDVLDEVYKHVDGWNSYELVEAQRPPTGRPTEQPSITPTNGPTGRPTQNPTALLTGATTVNPLPTRAPTQFTLPLIGPTIQSLVDSLGATPVPTISSTSTPTNMPTPPNSCNGYQKRKGCKKDEKCIWDKDGDICIPVGSVDLVGSGLSNERLSQPMGGTENQCSVHQHKDACKNVKDCKWKKDECVSKNRRLEEECQYDPIDFDLPLDAEVVECDGTSVTFESIDGHLTTRYHFLFSESTL